MKLKDRLAQIAFTVVKPFIKSFIKDQIKSQQAPIIALIKNKVDIPQMAPEEEVILYTKIYDAVEEAINLVIDRS